MRPSLAVLALFALAACGAVEREHQSQSHAAPLVIRGERELDQEFVVFPLQNAVARELANELRMLFSSNSMPGFADNGPLVVSDERTNSLIVRASAIDLGKIRALVAELDCEVHH